jgi:hypothetical protein
MRQGTELTPVVSRCGAFGSFCGSGRRIGRPSSSPDCFPCPGAGALPELHVDVSSGHSGSMICGYVDTTSLSKMNVISHKRAASLSAAIREESTFELSCYSCNSLIGCYIKRSSILKDHTVPGWRRTSSSPDLAVLSNHAGRCSRYGGCHCGDEIRGSSRSDPIFRPLDNYA